jgi:hypothetical protein
MMHSEMLSAKQVDAVIHMDGPDRYDYFIKKVVADGEAWGLFEDGWAMGSDAQGKPTFPIWPGKEFAALCAVGPWAEFEPSEIDLEDLVEELLPKLKKDGITPSVLRSPDGKSVLASVDQMLEDLTTEMG